MVSGIAYDPAATDGSSGIAHVDPFLGPRDSGGEFLASVVPGTNNVFQVETDIPNHLDGCGHC